MLTVGNAIFGRAGNDLVNATHTISGQPLPTGSGDLIVGAGGNDNLSGLGGNDRIDGGPGQDRIVGGPGSDVMSGAAGGDTFVFGAHFGHDVIIDFAAGATVGDVVEMHGLLHSLTQVRNHAHVDINHHLVIVVDAADTTTLNTVHSKAALSANDFHFFA